MKRALIVSSILLVPIAAAVFVGSAGTDRPIATASAAVSPDTTEQAPPARTPVVPGPAPQSQPVAKSDDLAPRPGSEKPIPTDGHPDCPTVHPCLLFCVDCDPAPCQPTGSCTDTDLNIKHCREPGGQLFSCTGSQDIHVSTCGCRCCDGTACNTTAVSLTCGP